MEDPGPTPHEPAPRYETAAPPAEERDRGIALVFSLREPAPPGGQGKATIAAALGALGVAASFLLLLFG
jgi:hypothetical protein